MEYWKARRASSVGGSIPEATAVSVREFDCIRIFHLYIMNEEGVKGTMVLGQDKRSSWPLAGDGQTGGDQTFVPLGIVAIPEFIRRFLNRGGYGRLSGSRCAIQNDDLPQPSAFFHSQSCLNSHIPAIIGRFPDSARCLEFLRTTRRTCG